MKCILCTNKAQPSCDGLCGSCYMLLDSGSITAIGVATETGKRIAELEANVLLLKQANRLHREIENHYLARIADLEAQVANLTAERDDAVALADALVSYPIAS